MTTTRHAHVALPLPVPDPYTYAVPPAFADRALPGARVVVPVRQQEMIGIVVATDVAPPRVAAREILATPDDVPALAPSLLELASMVGRHYGAPIGMVLRAMLPGAMWGRSRTDVVLEQHVAMGGTAGQLLDWLADRGGRVQVTAANRHFRRPMWDAVHRLQRIGAVRLDVTSPDTAAATSTRRVAVLHGDPLPLLERERLARTAPKRARIVEALETHGGRLPVEELLRVAGASDAPLRALVQAGVMAIEDEAVTRDPFASLPSSPPPPSPSAAQRDAIDHVEASAPGEETLLFGVTGSGKTLVYLHLVARALARGQGAIILVPEIALTPQTVARVRGMFGDTVAVLHSALGDGERADAWRGVREGRLRVVVGARSALFAPVSSLGVIVIDEEHEASYKNGELPRYHARDVAAMRARLEGARLVLGSATPSLESWQRATESGRLVRLPARVGDRPMPPVELVDLREAPSAGGAAVPWSAALDDALTATLARGEQALLLLNRRGWAAFLQCPSCGEVIDCPNCSISLTLHRHPDELRCHYCDHREPVVTTCRACGHATARAMGAGTQQLERLIAERFPAARVARMDVDTTGTKWAHHRILERVGRGDVDILLGTQMIAKGIDFPNVTLVGVVDADIALHLPDFRSAERTFQLVAQVAGRAGRGPRGGRVIVQSRQPGHPALQHAARHDTEGFIRQELELREVPTYPPHTALVHVVLTGDDQTAVMRRATALADWCERIIARAGLPVTVVGPAPCPIERIRERWRVHLILKGPSAALGRWVRTAAPRLGQPRGGVRVSIDRDPVSLL